GSASELEYQLLLVRDLGYLPEQDYEPLFNQVTEVEKMLTSFIRRLRATNC
ncbi:MAG: four helix bundle protein, partial [Anaerolineae bacterium]|nr:four helix bundle protein [Anaerolineae bacterium]